MNRYLLAGAAVAALSLGAGAANAETKFEVKVGGDAYFEAGYVGQDRDSGLRSTEFTSRFRVNVIPSAKADNGLEYGGRIRMRAASAGNGMTADKGYIFAQGSFGQVRMGNDSSFSDTTVVSTPIDYLPLGLFDRVATWIGRANATATTLTTGGYSGADIGGGVGPNVSGNTMVWPSLNPEGNATKIVYFSPRFAGLQLGASYTPRNDSQHTDVNRVKPTATTGAEFNGTYTDMIEVGANYKNTFGGVGLNAGAGYFWGSAVDGGVGDNFKDLNAWYAGAQLSYAGFAVGGSYTDFGKSGQNSRAGRFLDRTSNWTAGVQYTTGPIVVGANYKYGQDSGSTTRAGKRSIDVFEIGAGYTVAPGFTVQAQYDYYELKSDQVVTAATGDDDDKGNVVILRTVLAF